jgi:sec-independent protein translocase protein TatC
MGSKNADEMTHNKTMPFLEHIVELRKRLIYCVLITLVFSATAYCFYKQILDFLALPFAKIPQSLNQKFFVNTIFEGFGVFLNSFPILYFIQTTHLTYHAC